eukprot:TRINITY_DN5966_c0_g1_i1.p2 TRINITY_DN5966_c0_g1~~TRINITY_DN5966_c0_g1_i1.p2  ORF type:complete len:86 (-),score=4.36 TRINITY_DN5966_c0_g1_i1:341-598(-)
MQNGGINAKRYSIAPIKKFKNSCFALNIATFSPAPFIHVTHEHTENNFPEAKFLINHTVGILHKHCEKSIFRSDVKFCLILADQR